MKLKFFKKEKSFKKHRSGFDPNLLWEIVVCVGIVLVLLSFGFSYYLFTQINKDFVLPANNTGVKKMVNAERLKKVLDYFYAREQRSAEIINSPEPVVDPSL